jgi:hypothetical protein
MMMSEPTGGITCNICGADLGCVGDVAGPNGGNPAGAQDREAAGCTVCKSSLRLRSLIGLLSRELFGVAMALPEFPTMKGIRGIGMSDTPELAQRLAEKFDYTNTFYHQAPVFDVTKPDDRDLGRYDFILSSEVMEHVPPPVEEAFQTLCSLLKTDGLLLMTTPYSIGGKTVEHFPALHQFTLASLGGRPVLVNRRPDGAMEVFDDLVYHGGHGSTLEMRFFTEESLRNALLQAGFGSVYFCGESQPEFGVDHMEPFSLPIVARKGHFRVPAAELAQEYLDTFRFAARKVRDLEILTAEYERYIAFHADSQKRLEHSLEERTEWARKIEADFKQRTQWAQEAVREKDEAVADWEHLRKVEKDLRGYIKSLEKEAEEYRATLEKLQSGLWMRVGRKLGAFGPS